MQENIDLGEPATITAWGNIITDKRRYMPLDIVKVTIRRKSKDSICRLKVKDSKSNIYIDKLVRLSKGSGTTQIKCGGRLGIHTIFVDFGNKGRFDCLCHFLLEAFTHLKTGNEKFDNLGRIVRDGMDLNIREYILHGKKIRGYTTGDSANFDSIWLIDMIWQLKAYKYWEIDMISGLEHFYYHQNEDGSFWSIYNKDDKLHKMKAESDIEYMMVVGTYWTWQATGNDEWMRRHLPDMERGMNYLTSNELRWDSKYQLIKRPHTCDIWDFDIYEGTNYKGNTDVVAISDQSGAYLACKRLSEMYNYFGNKEKSEHWLKKSSHFYYRANSLLWEETKYLHHLHVGEIDHKNFNESKQLAMGNVFAINRGLADHEKAKSIIEEYRKRQTQTGDAYPWWTLQPGYPDNLEYYKGRPYLRQGGYANGGLMPFVGGELCKACFEHGYEEYALGLYYNYYALLRKSNYSSYTWYWPNGEPGFRTITTTNHEGMGMAAWFSAIQEGLAGIQPRGRLFNEVRVAPRWVAAREGNVYCISKYGASNAYFAYRYELDGRNRKIYIEYTGTGNKACFHILLPSQYKSKEVSLNAKKTKFKNISIERSNYVDFEGKIVGIGFVEVSY